VAVSFVVTCAQCRREVLEADVIGDEEECALRDHLVALHSRHAARDPERSARAFRRDRAAPAGRIAPPTQDGWEPLDLAQEFGDAVQLDLGGG